MLSLVLAALPVVSAAEVRLQVLPTPAPQSLVAMAAHGERTEVAVCAPQGGGAGPWSCAPMEVSSGSVELALSWDGQLVEVGAVVVPDATQVVQVRRQGGKVVVDTEGGLTTEAWSEPATDVVPTVLVRLSGDFSQGAPVVQLRGQRGSRQVACRDDGNFPDDLRNDGVQGCAGPAPGPRVGVLMQAAGGQPVDLGSFDLPGGEAFVLLEHGGTSDPATLATLSEAPWPAIAPPDPTPPEPGPGPTPPEPGPDPTPPEQGPTPHEQGPSPTAPQPLVAREAPQAHAGAAGQAGRGLVDLLAIIGAIAAGLALGWVVLPRGPRLPPGVEPLEAPPVFEGGPRLTDRVALLRTEVPANLAQELVRRLASQRPVLVVAPESVALTPVAGAPVYRSTSTDWEEVAQQVRGLARLRGLPPAVVVVGRHTLQAPGSVADDPPARLAEALPPGGWLGVVADDDAATIGFLTPWLATLGEGGWQLRQVEPA